jgi:alpha-1,6-mannosyltransferase
MGRSGSELHVDDAPTRDRQTGLFVLLGAIGFLGMAVISAAGVILGAPGTGSSLERRVVALAPSGTAGTAVGTIALIVGLAAAGGSWIAIGLVLRRGAPLRPLVAICAVWATPLLFGPPIFSRDVYSYAADGLMVSRHLEPNRYGPATLGGTHFLDPVSHVWLNTPSPYGPLFLRIAGWIVPTSHYSLVGTVMLLRLVAVLGVVLMGIALPKLAGALGKDPARAFWLGVCNPLVLIHFIAGAHNDSLMVGLMVAGLALAALKRPVAGILLCVLGATVKAPAALAAVFIIAETVRALPRKKRLATLIRLTGIGLGAFALIAWATQLGWSWIGALGVPGVNRSLLTPSTFAAHYLSMAFGHNATMLSLTRGVSLLLTAVGVAYLLWRAPKLGTVRACGYALALVVALGPIVLPWYALWALVVLAAAGSEWDQLYAVIATIVFLVVLQPSGSTMPDPILEITVVVLSVAAFVIACRPTRRWIQREVAVLVDDYGTLGAAGPVQGVSRRVAGRISRYRAGTSAVANRSDSVL